MRSTPTNKKPALFYIAFSLALGLALAIGFAIGFPIAAGAAPLPSPPSSSRPAPPRPPASTPAPGVKTVQAVRAAEPIALDGRLEEAVWKSTPAATGFTQNDPNDGSPATEPTDVWVAYDDHALYVAAFCRDSEPSKIRKRLGRRDTQTDSDWFMVAVDPYFDKRSGYAFYANPAGSITDMALSNDIGEDDSWDGIWETKAAVSGEGWTVEIRIPFNQIRFPKKDEYVWGVNFKRMVRRKNERSSFSWVPKSESAEVSRYARLEGL
ncbi:MAG: putative rane associated hydrolase, partial [Candidatus Aminicenantes bacterium]|nr:putative rane associated hydrolase [Candidatus Aminicenantes bacterium]